MEIDREASRILNEMVDAIADLELKENPPPVRIQSSIVDSDFGAGDTMAKTAITIRKSVKGQRREDDGDTNDISIPHEDKPREDDGDLDDILILREVQNQQKRKEFWPEEEKVQVPTFGLEPMKLIEFKKGAPKYGLSKRLKVRHSLHPHAFVSEQVKCIPKVVVVGRDENDCDYYNEV